MELLKPLGLSLLCIACVPDVDVDDSTVSEPRVLAIQAEPAEAAPNQPVVYRALVADRGGNVVGEDLTWYYCTAQKPLAELGPISQACLRGGDAVTRLGKGDEIDGTLPSAACSLFGPNPPAPVGNEPPGRPVDPDQTGGYKLPVLLGHDVGAGQDIVLYEQRIACGLSGVNPETSIAFNQRYHRNQNPELSAFRVNGALVGDDLLEVEQGAKVTLSVGWDACPESDVCGDGVCGPEETTALCAEDCQPAQGCGGQERYVLFDRERRELVVRRESLRVAWYNDAGKLENERTGVAASEVARVSENVFTAPSGAGDVHLWAVLRDDRGGVGYRAITLRVR